MALATLPTTLPPAWMQAGIPAQQLAGIQAQVAGPTQLTNGQGALPANGELAPGAILGPAGGQEVAGSQMAWWLPFATFGAGWLWEQLFGGEAEAPALPGVDPGGALVPQNGGGRGIEPYADFGGFGKGSPQAEGWITSGRTTDGTGAISAETFRAWDPIQQKYYQLHGNNPYSNITLMPGRVLPGIGGFITKSWVTHAWREDNSLASTQMAMTSNGRMISLSEDGRMKNWRPYKSIVIGKSLTTSNLRRVRTKVKSHAKSLKKILSIRK